ncbi:hypothetical protein VTN00DRAFT_1926 [Thermoascus crustaceus]|uniref:uncharacterized protein n=1 Tax=Thermoascus crustaceus TaxID=5088 RepID=UPI0037439806
MIPPFALIYRYITLPIFPLGDDVVARAICENFWIRIRKTVFLRVLSPSFEFGLRDNRPDGGWVRSHTMGFVCMHVLSLQSLDAVLPCSFNSVLCDVMPPARSVLSASFGYRPRSELVSGSRQRGWGMRPAHIVHIVTSHLFREKNRTGLIILSRPVQSCF